MANQFSVAPVNPLQALMLGEEGYKSQQQSGVREKAAQAMMSGMGGGSSFGASPYGNNPFTPYGTVNPHYG